jgi:hypothetical protein
MQTSNSRNCGRRLLNGVQHIHAAAAAAAAANASCVLLDLQSFAATTVEKTLQRLGTSFEVVPLPGDSAFVRPASILYELDGEQHE